MYFIGVDLGTSAVKLLLMEESGKICNIVSKEYPLFFPHPGWSEQNPEDWFSQSMEGMRELTEGIDRSQVAGIGFGGQMHGLVTLDKDDQVIRPRLQLFERLSRARRPAQHHHPANPPYQEDGRQRRDEHRVGH